MTENKEYKQVPPHQEDEEQEIDLMEYVRKLSFFMDVKIIFLTIKTVLVKEGISSESSATMEFFTGNEEV